MTQPSKAQLAQLLARREQANYLQRIAYYSHMKATGDEGAWDDAAHQADAHAAALRRLRSSRASAKPKSASPKPKSASPKKSASPTGQGPSKKPKH